jgi:hypothetical protein
MTVRYRLPDSLGGHEVYVVPPCPGASPPMIGCEAAALVAFPGTTRRMIMPEEWLTEVEPPLPPEPEDGTDLRVGEAVFSRRDDWSETNGEYRWYSTLVSHGPYDWRRINELYEGEWVRLVPDPAVDAPPLPYSLTRDDREIIRVEQWHGRAPGGNWEGGTRDRHGRRWHHVPHAGWLPSSPSPFLPARRQLPFRLKAAFNRRFPLYRICLYRWCLRGQTYQHRCHKHQEPR